MNVRSACLLLLCGSLFLWSHCASNNDGTCRFSPDCPLGQHCKSGSCVTGCTNDSECSTGQTCDRRGRCRGTSIKAQCQTNDDCTNGQRCNDQLQCVSVTEEHTDTNAEAPNGEPSSQLDGGTQSGTDKPLVCPNNQTRCGNDCVALLTDNKHCGQCNRVCSSTEQCKTASCVKKPNPILSIFTHLGTRTCALFALGDLKCWGIKGNSTPTQVVGIPEKVKPSKVGVGGGHICVVFEDEKLICWGTNNYGQCGYGSRGDDVEVTDTAVSFPSGLTPKDVYAGVSTTCAILSDNSTYCWGFGRSSELGDGNKEIQLSPVLAKEMGKDVKSLAMGRRFTCALYDGGKVKCWGDNSSLQLGVSTPGQFIPLGRNRYAVQVAAGREHACALLDNDSVLCWGSNLNGAVGQDNNKRAHMPATVTLNRGAYQITAGEDHTCAILLDRTVRCWGKNNTQQLGIRRTSDPKTYLRVLPTEPLQLTGLEVVQIVAGSFHTCVLTQDQKVLCWGLNSSGQIGNGKGASNTAYLATLVQF